jgi:ABC-2 type transport system permease protein
MNRVLTLAAYNVRLLLSEKSWFILGWALFFVQMTIYGSLMGSLVGSNIPDYFFFYAIGLMIITVFDGGSQVGRHLVENAHSGELPYYLSLPISRRGFLAALSLYGIANTMLRILPPLLVILALLGRLTVQGAVFATVAMFLLGLGISGIMVSMSFIAFKSVDIYSALIAGLSALLIRFSTVFYPLILMPNYYSPVSALNPLTYGADLTRWVLGYDPGRLLNPLLAAAVVTAVAVGTLSLSAGIIDKVIEGVKAA